MKQAADLGADSRSELRQTVAALAKSEARFRRLTELSSDWYWEQDAKLRFVQVAGADSALSHHQTARHLGRTLWQIAAIAAPADGWAVHMGIVQAHLPFHDLELQVQMPGAPLRWMALSGLPVFADDGRFTGYQGIGRDITSVRQAATAQQEALERLQKIASRLPGMVFQYRLRVDGSTCMPFASEAIRDLFDLEPDVVRENVAVLAAMVHPDDLDRMRANLHQSAHQLTPWREEYRVRGADGVERWMSHNAIPEREPGGSTLWNGFTSDITERKHAQAAVASALQEKSALLQEVHHRVKNNLQVIVSLLRLESRRGETGAVKAVLDDMQGRIRAMGLLHESLYRSGVFATTDLKIYLRELATQSFRAMASNDRPVRLELDLEPVRVSLQQGTPCGLIANELITNCFKHGLVEGKVGTLRVSLQRVPDSPQVRLQVSDDGGGFPADHARRAQHSLGLQLVGDLAEQLDATLDIGPGSLVTVTFTPDSLPDGPDKGG